MIDAETPQLINSVPVDSPVAVDGGVAYWLDGTPPVGTGTVLTLR